MSPAPHPSHTELAFRNLIANGAHSSSCAFCITSYKDWPRRNEKIRNHLPKEEWTFLIIVFHFFNWKIRDESPAPLETVFVGSTKGKGALFSLWKSLDNLQVPPTDLIPPLTKVSWISSPTSQSVSKKRRRFKSLVLSEDGWRAKSQKISAPLHFIKIYQMRPLLAWSISLDSIFHRIDYKINCLELLRRVSAWIGRAPLKHFNL